MKDKRHSFTASECLLSEDLTPEKILPKAARKFWIGSHGMT